jgi:hypothetical protein
VLTPLTITLIMAILLLVRPVLSLAQRRRPKPADA